MATACPICERRRGKRHCPGLGRSRWRAESQTICAQCCGAQREVTIDCPADCPYLIAAHRYETERTADRAKKTELAFPKVAVEQSFLEDKQALVTGLSLTVVRFAREHPELVDAEALAALAALAESYQTLESGLYYEQKPAGPAAQALTAALRTTLEQYSQEQQQRFGASLRPSEALRALVFLARLGQLESNGRALSRRYLGFLQAQLPSEAAGPEPPRLIIPGH